MHELEHKVTFGRSRQRAEEVALRVEYLVARFNVLNKWNRPEGGDVDGTPQPRRELCDVAHRGRQRDHLDRTQRLCGGLGRRVEGRLRWQYWCVVGVRRRYGCELGLLLLLLLLLSGEFCGFSGLQGHELDLAVREMDEGREKEKKCGEKV